MDDNNNIIVKKGDYLCSEVGTFVIKKSEDCITKLLVASEIYIPFMVRSKEKIWYFIFKEDIDRLLIHMPSADGYAPCQVVGSKLLITCDYELVNLCPPSSKQNLYYNKYITGSDYINKSRNLNAICFCKKYNLSGFINDKDLILAKYFIKEVKRWGNMYYMDNRFYYRIEGSRVLKSFTDKEELLRVDNNHMHISQLVIENYGCDANVKSHIENILYRINLLFTPLNNTNIELEQMYYNYFKNGVVYLKPHKKSKYSLELSESGNKYFLQQYNYEYKKLSAGLRLDCTKFYDYLRTCYFYNHTNSDISKIVNCILIIIGQAILSSECNLLYCFFGGGGDGKSYIIKLIKWLLKDYDSDRFHTIHTMIDFSSSNNNHLYQDIVYKKLIIGSEISKKSAYEEKYLKEITGGEEIEINRKYKDKVLYTPQGSVILQLNNADPAIHSLQASIRRRAVYMFFINKPHRFEDERHPENVFTFKEKQLIINLALRCYVKYINNIGNKPKPDLPDYMKYHFNLLCRTLLHKKKVKRYIEHYIAFTYSYDAERHNDYIEVKSLTKVFSMLGLINNTYTPDIMDHISKFGYTHFKIRNSDLHKLILDKLQTYDDKISDFTEL